MPDRAYRITETDVALVREWMDAINARVDRMSSAGAPHADAGAVQAWVEDVVSLLKGLPEIGSYSADEPEDLRIPHAGVSALEVVVKKCHLCDERIELVFAAGGTLSRPVEHLVPCPCCQGKIRWRWPGVFVEARHPR